MEYLTPISTYKSEQNDNIECKKKARQDSFAQNFYSAGSVQIYLDLYECFWNS